MLLLIDIGNTNTKIGLHEDDTIKDVFNFRTTKERDTTEYSYIIEGVVKQHGMKMPRGAVICSVVPEVATLLAGALKKSFGIEPLNVTYKTKTGFKFPRGIGADRIACMTAARMLYEGDLLVAAFGTATTFNVITKDGKYRGGAIMPGIEMSINALAEKTAKLPRVELKTLSDKMLNKDTENNILSGVILGHAGAVERIIHEMEKELGGALTVVATGGFMHHVAQHLPLIDHVNSLLTLEGLRVIYELNTRKVRSRK